jgi:hypothetical protein
LIDKEGIIKICDFGCSTKLETEDSFVKGTEGKEVIPILKEPSILWHLSV